jgi:CRISPR-associated endonuclease Csn1
MDVAWGIDVGIASVGFAVIEIDEMGEPARLIDGAAHVFKASDGAAERRGHRSMRNQTQRAARRERYLKRHLVDLFQLSKLDDSALSDMELDLGGKGSKAFTDRIPLRALGLEQQLTKTDLCCAIMHIARNRGQRLSRGLGVAITDEDGKAEVTRMSDRANHTTADLVAHGKQLNLVAGVPATPGQLLWRDRQRGLPTRRVKSRKDAPIFTRGQVIDELDRLLKTQAKHHPELDETGAQELLINKTFWEKDPKPPTIGRCRYARVGTDGLIEERLPVADDLFQEKRILETLNNLRLISRETAKSSPINLEQRDILASHLMGGEDLSVSKLRTLLSLGKAATAPTTNMEEVSSRSKKRTKTPPPIPGHNIVKALRAAPEKSRSIILSIWANLGSERRAQLANVLRTEDDPQIAFSVLADEFGFPEEAVDPILKYQVSPQRSAAGPTATAMLRDKLKKDVISNYEAERQSGLIDKELALETRLERLPYYGRVLPNDCVGGDGVESSGDEKRYGKVTNPVVHQALNRIRRLANRYLEVYGPPRRINVELARDLNKSAEARAEIELKINQNTKQNQDFANIIRSHGARVGRANLQKMLLHEWQGQKCLYTGSTITIQQLFDGSSQVDHILPWAITKDDSIGNKALVKVAANAHKSRRTPYDAFAAGYAGQSFAQILHLVETKRKPILWRFSENALAEHETRGGWASRALSDTRYIAKLAQAYLQRVCIAGPSGHPEIVALSGRTTADLREVWGLRNLISKLMVDEGRLDSDFSKEPDVSALDEKEATKALAEHSKKLRKIRFDHRHHLLDAIVIACATRRDIQRLQTLAARVETPQGLAQSIQRMVEKNTQLANGGLPWRPGFHRLVYDFLSDVGASEDPSILTRVTRQPDHDSNGKLHAGTQYRVYCELPKPASKDADIPTEPEYIYDVSKPLSELVTEKAIEALPVSGTIQSAFKQALSSHSPIWWGGANAEAAFNNLSEELADLCSNLLTLLAAAPEELKGEKARALWATEEHTKTTGRKNYRALGKGVLRVIKGPGTQGNKQQKRNRLVVATSGNDRLDHWLDQDGEDRLEVVSTIDANNPHFRARWKIEGGRLLASLRLGDTVEMYIDPEQPDLGRALYTFAQNAWCDWNFVPLAEARTANEGRGIFTVRLASKSGFINRRIRQILLSPDGRVRWRGRVMN